MKINILNNNVELNYGNNWDSSWSVSNQRHRWALGMRVMGYEGTKPEDMPKPTNWWKTKSHLKLTNFLY